MKFSNGAWLMQEGVTPHYASEVRHVDIKDNCITIYAPFQHIRHRGDTLTGPLFTLEITSPALDLIAVKAYHFKSAACSAQFEITHQQLPLKAIDSETCLEVFAGKTKVKIYKKDWLIEYFYNNKLMTSSSGRAMGMMLYHGDKYMCESLTLGVGEKIYGLGERFSSFIKNGQRVDIWNEDGGTGTEQSYKSIPFYVSSNGYGLLVNDAGKVSFEVASEKVSRVQFSVPGNELEYIFIPGDTPKDILKKYGGLTGLPGLPPAWSFGLWLTTSFTTDYDEHTVTHFVDGMAERNLPLHTFHFDCFWMKEFEWCNFKWDEAVFPDPEGMIKRLKDKGLHICVWINPYIGQKSPLFDEGVRGGYFIKNLDGSVWQWDLWQPGMAIVDFTNPEACRWYEGYLEALIDMGVDAFKTDFGERIPVESVRYFDGARPEKMHNYYAYLYNKVVYELLSRKLGKDQAVLFARSASVGSQKFPVHWGGDCTSVYESMAESLRGGLSLSLCGFGFWSHDIGGFESTSTADIYKRWIAFGLLSSHSRLHGSSSYRVPWLYDDESVDVLRHFTQLKCSLMPYLYAQAHLTAQSGIPMMRAMFLEHPNDPACHYLDTQYYLGDSLIVAPIFNEDGVCTYYLPEGEYTHFMTNDIKKGGSYFTEIYDYFSLPLFVKPNTILAVGNHKQAPDYDYLDQIAYHVFALEDITTLTLSVYNTENREEETVMLIKEDADIIIKRKSHKPAKVILRNVHQIESANCAYKHSYLGIEFYFEGSQDIVITL